MAKTYVDLVADINSWLLREDLEPAIPTFILLAETRHKGMPELDGSGGVRVRAQIKRSRIVGRDPNQDGSGSRFLPLPVDYLEMDRLTSVDNLKELVMVSTSALLVGSRGDRLDDTLQSADPFTYAIHEEIEFTSNVTPENTFEMVYWSTFAPVTVDNPSNWLLENGYGAYLYGALVEASPYLVADDRINTWENQYRKQVLTIQSADRRSRHSASPRVTHRYPEMVR